MTKRLRSVVLVLAAVGTLPSTALADEIVHFTNGAEMAVRSHTVEQEKSMVRLDLGGNSFIAFPMSMVDKIVSAGKDVFLNPVFHPSNQAVAGTAVADNSRGASEPAINHRRPGAILGEVADSPPATAIAGQPIEQPVAASRRIFTPGYTAPPGSGPQVIMPPGKRMQAPQLSMIPLRPPDPQPAPPPAAESPDNQQGGEPTPEEPPDTP